MPKSAYSKRAKSHKKAKAGAERFMLRRGDALYDYKKRGVTRDPSETGDRGYRRIVEVET